MASYTTHVLTYTPRDADGAPLSADALSAAVVTLTVSEVGLSDAEVPHTGPVDGVYTATYTPRTGSAVRWRWEAAFGDGTVDVERGVITVPSR